MGILKYFSILMLFVIQSAFADNSSQLQGHWIFASTRACASEVASEDPLFRLYMRDYSLDIHSNTIVESMNVDGCLAQIVYDIRVLPSALDGTPAGFMPRLELTRKNFSSTCLRRDTRPEKMTLSYLSYPDFFETYEPMLDSNGVCPMGDYVISQFKRSEKQP